MTLTLRYNSTTLDLSNLVSTYTPKRVYTSGIKVITTLSGREWAFPLGTHDVLDVSLKPLTKQQVRQLAAFFASLSGVWMQVTYTDPHEATATVTRDMRLTNDWSNRFLLTSVDGATRYSGGQLSFRSQ